MRSLLKMDNISFIGMAGCGKSTLGKAISEKHGLSFIDTDHLIESEYKMTLEDVKKEFGYKFVRSAEEKLFLVLIKQRKLYQQEVAQYTQVYPCITLCLFQK